MSEMHNLFLRKLLPAAFCLALVSSAFHVPASAAIAKKKVLSVSVTKGFRHSSIPLTDETIKDLGVDSGLWEMDYARTDEDIAQKMTPAALEGYDCVFFNNTTGTLPIPDRQGFLDWVKAGGCVAGTHACTDVHDWPEFVDMIGAEFAGHGAQSMDEYLIQDTKHPATRGLSSFKLTEEVYMFTNWSRDKIRMLISLDKHPNSGEPGDYPISWVRNYGQGRVFYTALGHREDVLQNEIVLKHLLGGMKWVLGFEKGAANPVPPPAPVTKKEKKDGFRPLFNTKDLTGWHVRTEGRTAWTAQNGMLVIGKGGTDLITDEKFGNFIIRYEYMVPKGGNSGLYLRGRYEIQVMDDFEGKKPELHGNGSIYGVIAPSAFASRAPGEWQTVEAKLVGKNVTVILNGVKIIDSQPIPNATGGALDDKVDEPGPIMVQGDHSPIAYRNIRIKTVK